MSTLQDMLKKRQDLLLPTVARLREEIRDMDGRLLAIRSGADWREGSLRLSLLGQEYEVQWPEAIVREENHAEEARSDLQVLLLTYLRNADGTPPSGHWLSFRELPDGGFYHLAFQSYAPNRLAERFGHDTAAFRRAGELSGGRREAMGDASFSYRALPQLWLAAVLWEGDEEFPASARILFDDNCGRYLATDLLATLGRMLVSQLLKAAP
jgi:hypothetical protein